MAKNQVAPPPLSSTNNPQRPANITLPPRPDTTTNNNNNYFLSGSGGFGLSPGPMTLVSSFFADSDTPRSFSQLLAGAMASSPSSAPTTTTAASVEDNNNNKEDPKYKESRPQGLMMSESHPLFTIPPGMSPSGLLNSPGIFPFSPPQSPLPFGIGMSHQQALAQVTAQAALAQSNLLNQVPAGYNQNSLATSHDSYSNNISLTTNTEQQKPELTSDSKVISQEPSEVSQNGSRSQISVVTPDKPESDGYNWRKYGQKQVKGSDYPRSYYRCSHLACPVKKKVERSLDGHIIEIIYKGQHNHEMSPPKKPAKDAILTKEDVRIEANRDNNQYRQLEVAKGSVKAPSDQKTCWEDLELVQLASQKSNDETEGNTDTSNDPTPKKRKIAAKPAEPTPSQNTVVEAKIVVQTRSEVDLLDDGFRWRKYGQKVVKGNTHPRSYYKCTTPGCRVRKHVERASADPKAVITTYEGKHNHEFPAGRGNSHNISPIALPS